MTDIYGGYNNYYPVDYTLLKNLEEYIHDEIKDSMYYAILAGKAPTRRAKELILEFSRDEMMHAENFMKAYTMLTGKAYTPPNVEKPKVIQYREALNVRVLAETADYKKYGEQYLKAFNPYLKDLFFMTRTDEAIHAIRLNMLM